MPGTAFLMGMMAAAAQLAWQVATLDIDDAENCLARFRSNRDFGAIVLGAILHRHGPCGNILSCAARDRTRKKHRAPELFALRPG